MATKKGVSKNEKAWFGFYNHDFTPEEKARVGVLVRDMQADTIIRHLSQLAGAGYKVSLSHNPSTGVYVCTATGGKDTVNNGYALVVNHVEAEKAVLAVSVIVCEVYDFGKWNVEDSTAPSW